MRIINGDHGLSRKEERNKRSPDLALGEEPSNIDNRSKRLRKQLWLVNPNFSLSNSYSYKIKTQRIEPVSIQSKPTWRFLRKTISFLRKVKTAKSRKSTFRQQQDRRRHIWVISFFLYPNTISTSLTRLHVNKSYPLAVPEMSPRIQFTTGRVSYY